MLSLLALRLNEQFLFLSFSVFLWINKSSDFYLVIFRALSILLLEQFLIFAIDHFLNK